MSRAHIIAWAKSIAGIRDNISNDCMCANNGGASGVCGDNYAKMEVELTVTDSNTTYIQTYQSLSHYLS